jgi:hypothetical protein
MKLPAKWLTTLQRVQSAFPEALIAGGALRDLAHGKPVKDVDIFVRSRGTTTKALLEAALRRPVQQLVEELAEYEGQFTDVANVFDVMLDDLDDEDRFQIIALNMPITMLSLVERFDFGLCRIATNGKMRLEHDDYVHDVLHRRFTYRLADNSPRRMDRSFERFDRLCTKYPGYGLYSAAGELLAEAAGEPFTGFDF